eukprot:scaffold672495_cov47-Prasinocladus_malaysianus.AAC.1
MADNHANGNGPTSARLREASPAFAHEVSFEREITVLYPLSPIVHIGVRASQCCVDQLNNNRKASGGKRLL